MADNQNVSFCSFDDIAQGRPFVIAEIGVNHEGSLQTAKTMIELARASGADAVKFQSYKAVTLAAAESPAYWNLKQEPTTSQRELFKKYDRFDPEDYEELKQYCNKCGVEFMSTPFDLYAAQYLNRLQGKFKIASADITNIPLLRQVGSFAKPVILSTGAAAIAEIDIAVRELMQAGAPDVALLHCVLNYPCAAADANLRMIGGLKRCFPGRIIGYSDHVPPDANMTLLTAAWLSGAQILEKHFTFDKSRSGNDHYHAMDAADLKRFIANVDMILPALGRQDKAPLESERLARLHARRSIVAACDIAAGETLTSANLTCKRPGHGVSPSAWDDVVGARAARAIRSDALLQWADVEK